MNEIKNYKTRYFGTLAIDFAEENFYFDTEFNEQEINLFIDESAMIKEKMSEIITLLDRYEEMNKKAKQTIIDNFVDNEVIKYYFECHFDVLDEDEILQLFGTNDFSKIDINETVKNLPFPNLMISIEDVEIEISVDYVINKYVSNQILCVKMDSQLNVNDFSHES